MDFSKFKETEQQYRELKEKLGSGEINPEYMKKELKKMMVLDENGNYWMIGGKTGKWYIYNGTEWKENSPFQENPKSTALYTEPVKETSLDTTTRKAGEEEVEVEDSEDQKKYEHEYGYEGEDEDEEPFSLNVTTGPLDLKTENPPIDDERLERVENAGRRVERRVENVESLESVGMDMPDDEQDTTDHFTICKICKAKISIYSIYCPVCGANRKEAAAPSRKIDRAVVKENELLLASVKIASLIFFMGGLGLIVGVFCGAAFGVFKTLIPEFQPLLPDMLSETRGGWPGV